jgi:hypothetical protein
MLCVKSPNRFKYAESLSDGFVSATTSELTDSDFSGETAGDETMSVGDLRDRRDVPSLDVEMAVDEADAGPSECGLPCEWPCPCACPSLPAEALSTLIVLSSTKNAAKPRKIAPLRSSAQAS